MTATAALSPDLLDPALMAEFEREIAAAQED
jgi:hypothetical protein